MDIFGKVFAGVSLALFIALAAVSYKLNSSEKETLIVQKAFDDYKIKVDADALAQAKFRAATQNDLVQTHQGEINEANQKVVAAELAASAAGSQLSRLQHGFAARPANRCAASPVAGAASGSDSTDDTGLVQADVFNRATNRIHDLDQYADKLRIAAETCVGTFNRDKALIDKAADQDQ